jgi:hypothetical protein
MSASRSSRSTPTSEAVFRAIRPICSLVRSGAAEASMPITRRGRAPASSSAAKPATIRLRVCQWWFDWRFQGPVIANMMPGVWMLA